MAFLRDDKPPEESLQDMQRWVQTFDEYAANSSNPAAQEYWAAAAKKYRERIANYGKKAEPGQRAVEQLPCTEG